MCGSLYFYNFNNVVLQKKCTYDEYEATTLNFLFLFNNSF